MKGIRRFFYLDHDGIEGLYAQIFGGTPESLVVSQQAIRRGQASIEAGATFPLVKGGLAAVASAERSSSSSASMSIRAETLLERIEDTFATANPAPSRFLVSVSDLLESSIGHEIQYFQGTLPWRLRKTHHNDPVKDAEKKESIELVYPRLDTEAGAALNCDVIMTASLSKLVDYRIHPKSRIGPTSHLAIALRAMDAHATRMSFFARRTIYPTLIHLKPYAVWFT